MEGNNEILIGGLSEADVVKLKRQHKIDRVILVTIKSDKEEGKEEYFFFKPMSLEVYAAMLKVGQNDMMKGAKVIFINCLVHGDKTACDDLRFLGIMPQLDKLTTNFQSSVKEL